MSWYVKRKDLVIQHVVAYTDAYTEEIDTEGLKTLKWSMFDSPEKLGSGKNFMESEPVFILDKVLTVERISAFIILGYASKPYADKLPLPTNSSHRVGKAVKLKCENRNKRIRIVKGLIQYGIERIHISNDWIYFDTDSYLKKPELIVF